MPNNSETGSHPLPASSLKIPPRNSIPTIPSFAAFLSIDTLESLEHESSDELEIDYADLGRFMNEIEATRVDLRLPDDAACLERLCSRTVGRLVKDMMREELDQEQGLDDDLNLNMDLDIDDEDSITARIQDFLDTSDDILCAKDHKQRNPIFRAIYNSEFEFTETPHLSSLTGSRPLILVPLRVFCSCFTKRTGDRYISTELHDEWERDCVKKAERKRLCELERIAAVADPFTLKKKGGKKARKAARQAAASVSLGTVVGHIRRFVEDLGRASTLSLPLMARHAHKSVHELAHAFSLESKSVGNGAGRFSKLVRTFGGVRVDERNVVRIWSSRRRCMGAVVQWKGERKIWIAKS
ncbi:hypothetical protein EDB85DRAFT_2291097 [Lactarius pseudohatsudake]|nr:hypothetical protein EDB85DRAFT_2291097 [Lactarius pseudohatsudake]